MCKRDNMLCSGTFLSPVRYGICSSQLVAVTPPTPPTSRGAEWCDEVRGMNLSDRFSILITDDDDECRQILREIVEPEGFRTLQASSGEEAVDIVREESVHLVLLDMHLP